MLLEEKDLIIIGLITCIIGIGIILMPLLRIKEHEKTHTSLSVMYQIEDYIVRSKLSFITGLIWIICGCTIQLGAYLL